MEIKIYKQLDKKTLKQLDAIMANEEYELFYDADEYIYDTYFINPSS